jgi:hypothetical protein
VLQQLKVKRQEELSDVNLLSDFNLIFSGKIANEHFQDMDLKKKTNTNQNTSKPAPINRNDLEEN